MIDNKTNQPCPKCNGTGILVHESFTSIDGTVYPETRRPCFYCDGKGFYPPVNIPEILEQIKGRKGLRSKRPESKRAYYVWRMARFHGGADVTMPVCASMDCGHDPFIEILDLIADKVAKRVFGTDKAAAYRWMNALGHDLPVLEGMPASAYSGGPVADDNKPIEEMPELIG